VTPLTASNAQKRSARETVTDDVRRSVPTICIVSQESVVTSDENAASVHGDLQRNDDIAAVHTMTAERLITEAETVLTSHYSARRSGAVKKVAHTRLPSVGSRS